MSPSSRSGSKSPPSFGARRRLRFYVARRQRRRVGLGIERLEDRALLAISSLAPLADGYATDTPQNGTFPDLNTTAADVRVRDYPTSIGYPGDDRGLLEFHVAPLGAGLSIDAAEFGFQKNAGYGGNATVDIFAYAADGVLTAADATTPATLVGTVALTSATTYAVPLNSSALQAIYNTSDHIGIRLAIAPSSPGYGFGMYSTEGTPPSFPQYAPRLTLTTSGTPVPSLSVTVSPKAAAENAGAAAATGTVTRLHADTSSPLTVSLSTSDPTEAVPAVTSVTIPAGATSASFGIQVLDDTLLDGGQAVRFEAVAEGFASGDGSLLVTDFEILSVTAAQSSVSENAGAGATTVTITRSNTDISSPLTVTLTDTSPRLSLPASAIIPAQEASVTVPVDVADNEIVDGNASVQVRANAAGYQQGTTNILVVDDDGGKLRPGNILVAVENRYVHEYKPDGTLIQTFMVNPQGGISGQFRDLVVNDQGDIEVINGTSVLSNIDIQTKAVSNHTAADWSTGGNIAAGGVARLGRYLYVNDVGTTRGVIRFDTLNGYATTRANTAYDIFDVSIGLDGKLYALESGGFGNRVTVIDPLTMQLLGNITLQSTTHRGLAVNAAGEIFATGWEESLYKYDAQGNLIGYLATGWQLDDIDLDATGRIVAAGDAFNLTYKYVVMTDERFQTLTVFSVTNDQELFVAFANPDTTSVTPVLTPSGAGTTLVENGSSAASTSVIIDPGLTLTDDGNTMTKAVIRITKNYVPGQDSLSVFSQSGIVAQPFDSKTGTITLSGAASVAAYQTALRSVRYANSSNSPDTRPRTITFSAVDQGWAGTADVIVPVVSSNDALPVANNDSYSVVQNQVLQLAPVTVDKLTLQSDPGEFVGQGQNHSLTGNLSIAQQYGTAGARFQYVSGNVNWSLSFRSTNGPMAVGLYPVATRTGGNGTAELDVSGNGRGSGRHFGSFEVHEVEFGPTGALLRFAASFVQYTESQAKALRGTIDYRSTHTTKSGVIINDTDADNGRLTISGTTSPAHGQVVMQANGVFTYTPHTGYFGADSFNYTLRDSDGATATGTVNINVTPIPGITITGAPLSVSEAGASDTFDVVLNVQPAGNVVLTITNTDASEAAVDKASLTFTPANWNTPQTVTVTGVDDFIDDGDQESTIIVAVNDAASHDAYDGVADVAVRYTNVDDDTAGITVTPTDGKTAVSESGSTDQLNVVLNAQPLSNVVLSVSSSDTGEATVSPGTLTFTPANWNVAQTVTVTGANDSIVDGVQTSLITISVIDGSSDNAFDPVADVNVEVTTADNDSALLALGDASISEGHGGSQALNFPLTLSLAADIDITVDYHTSDGTATAADGDYVAVTSPLTVTIPAGTTSGWLTVQVNGDKRVEPQESFGVVLSNLQASGRSVTAGPGATGTILNDETGSIAFSAAVSGANEGTPLHEVTVRLHLPEGATLSAPATVEVGEQGGGTADTPADYQYTPQTVSFSPGDGDGAVRTVQVSVSDDPHVEGDETLELALSNLVEATGQLTLAGTAGSEGHSRHTVGIQDDDTATVAFAVAASSVSESISTGSHELTVSLSIPSGGTLAHPVSVDMRNLGSGTADSGDFDFHTSPKTIVFPAGSSSGSQTVSVTILDDAHVEGDDTLDTDLHKLSDGTGGQVSLGARKAHTVTIRDDDVAMISFVSSASSPGESAGTHAVAVKIEIPGGGALLRAISVDVARDAAAPGTASKDQDYRYTDSTLTFEVAPFEATKTVTLEVLPDTLLEGDESLQLKLANLAAPPGALVSLADSSAHTVTILDDEAAQITFAAAAGSVAEATGSQEIAVQLVTAAGVTLAPGVTLTADIVDAGTGSAAAGSDYSPFGTQTVSFSPGATNGAVRAVTVAVLGDAIDEDHEHLELRISQVSGPSTSIGATAAHKLTIQDDDTAGIQVSAISGNTTEAGGKGTFTLVLTSQPTASVTIGLSSSDPTEGAVSPGSVTFTADNWNAPQTVTVTGLDDAEDDGDIAYQIVTAAAASSDPRYAGLNPADVAVVNIDNDTAGITVSAISGHTTESGGTATFTVVLNSKPTATVRIGVSSTDPGEGTPHTSELTFSTSNWHTPQTVTVTGVDDLFVDGDVSYTIVLAAAVSSDGLYHGINPTDVAVTNLDNDVPLDFFWYPVSGQLVTGGTAYSSGLEPNAETFRASDVRAADGNAQQIREGEAVYGEGKSAKKSSALDYYQWSFGAVEDVTSFRLVAWRDANGEADDFRFEYSLDGGAWTPLATVASATSTAYNVNFAATPLNGNLVLRVVDTDRAPVAKRVTPTLESIHVDAVSFQSRITDLRPRVNLTATDAMAAESPLDLGQFTLSREGTSGDLPVYYAVSGSATNGSDYGLLTGLAVIPNGQSTTTISVAPIDDQIAEGNESVVLTLLGSNEYFYKLGSSTAGTVVIQDNDLQLFTATSESTVAGTIVANNLAATVQADGTVESLEERNSGGKTSSRTSYLDHRWTFSGVTGARSFYLTASRTANTEGDNFRFELSTNGGSTWTHLATVAASSLTLYPVSLPVPVSGAVVVRVVDTDPNTPGHSSRDRVHIDQMYFSTAPVAPFVADPSSSVGGGSLLTRAELDAAATRAVDYWRQQGADTAGLASQAISFEIVQLAEPYLGLAYPAQHRIQIDLDAAGFGWNRADLFATLVHEIGHLYGGEHDELGESLAVGTPGAGPSLAVLPAVRSAATESLPGATLRRQELSPPRGEAQPVGPPVARTWNDRQDSQDASSGRRTDRKAGELDEELLDLLATLLAAAEVNHE